MLKSLKKYVEQNIPARISFSEIQSLSHSTFIKAFISKRLLSFLESEVQFVEYMFLNKIFEINCQRLELLKMPQDPLFHVLPVSGHSSTILLWPPFRLIYSGMMIREFEI